MSLRLIAEKPEWNEEFEYIVEEKDRKSPSTLFIKGPYMMAEGVNRNNRLYPLHELVREVDRYKSEMITNFRSLGELNHPQSAEVNPERACHMVTELHQDGNIFIGKSKVLSTPVGLVVKALINDGVKLGMSSRALGQLEEKGGKNIVKNLRLVAIDCVADPSYPKAFVNGILESKQYVLSENGNYEELYNNFESSLRNLPKRDVESFLKESIINFLKNLK
jgi:Prohead core protein serine protease